MAVMIIYWLTSIRHDLIRQLKVYNSFNDVISVLSSFNDVLSILGGDEALVAWDQALPSLETWYAGHKYGLRFCDLIPTCFSISRWGGSISFSSIYYNKFGVHIQYMKQSGKYLPSLSGV